MKKLYTFLFFVMISVPVFSQVSMPNFLEGTWKMENREVYEVWEAPDNGKMNGYSYRVREGEKVITEYLEIKLQDNDVIYTATVLNQNEGRGIDFVLNRPDTLTWSFENPDHDFPKVIQYQKRSDSEIYVQVSDGGERGFVYKMDKQLGETTVKDTTGSNPNYDAALADKLGADDYGMKGYIFVILKTGPNKTTDQAIINESFKGHLENINRLVEQNKLIVAGPFGRNENTYRGLFILNVSTVAEAEELLQTDPAIKNGLLDAELYSWYGSAALPAYLEYSDKIWKVKP
jgi:uncharacterized protein YciI